MSILWTNTAKALQDFVSILVCGKCGSKPISPVRLTNCGHFFCHDCVKSATLCVKCNVPVQPREIHSDCLVSNLIQGCDTIAQIIKRENIWDHTGDVSNVSLLDTTVSEIFSTSRKQVYIRKRNINKPDGKGETQLHTTCLKRNAEQVKHLLMLGANPNTKDHAGWTPLQEIVNYGYIDICKLLLSCGASPNIPGYEKRTPLHEAAELDRIEEAKLLLEYHADKNLCDEHGKKPIDYCKTKEMQQLLNGVQSSSEKILNKSINQTLDMSIYARCGKLVIYPSNLKQESQKLLNAIAAKHKIKILTTYRSSVTHITVEVNERNITKLTLDVLFGIVHGNWLLNSEWIKLAEDMDDISDIDFELFEVNGAPTFDVPRKARLNMENQNPRLFNNCFFYFALQADTIYQIDDVKLKKSDLILLVKAGEGTVLTREPNPEDLEGMTQLIPYHIASDLSHPLYKCTHYIIYVPGKGEPRIKYNMPHIKSLPLIWLIECIEKFTLINPAHLGLI